MPIARMPRAANKAKTKIVKNKAKAATKNTIKTATKPVTAARSKRAAAVAPAPVDAERYALALESINENLYEWDIENDTVYFAPGLFKILGLSAAQMRKPSDWINRVHPDDQPLFKYTLAE